jgi:predicted molibdopterin-dependent oxidoreductase YjgC
VPDLSLRADRAPNGTGADHLGYARTTDADDVLRNGDLLVVADDELDGIAPDVLARAADVLVIGTVLPGPVAERARVVLPITTFAEEEGTFTNLRGRVQRFLQAKAPPGMARPSWSVLADLLEATGAAANHLVPADVFAALAAAHAPFAGLSYARLGLRGLPVLDAAPAEAGA